MFATIGQWFFEDLAGLRSDAAGFGKIVFQPTIPSKLDDAHASIETLARQASAHWFKVGGNGLEYDVTVPPEHDRRGARARLGPVADRRDRFRPALVAGNAPGVTLVGVQKDAVVYKVASGTYKFRVGSDAFAATAGRTATSAARCRRRCRSRSGAPAAFGAFTPGVAKDYTRVDHGHVISTAGDATLSVADPSSVATGHLVNGAFSLPSALQASAFSKSRGPHRSPTTSVTIGLHAAHRRHRRAAHRRLQQDAHLHAEHHHAVNPRHAGRGLNSPGRRAGFTFGPRAHPSHAASQGVLRETMRTSQQEPRR